ncbi:MAG: YggS family pyridoxal phosphate-dependent enzyme [Candidatus Delongbacteria bacterium]|nr:YggS family pyridoxal phosphate-dependent enzyme [Candidatus Delongbacteria bacterium]MBN2834040.1 YggS family pyridoxal phosphate-dependent enzyme [Candidatus Delongbacteria bacterium]
MIGENLKYILNRIENLDPSKEVKLIAVSKTKPVEDLEEAIRSGQKIFGENKVQELCQKAEYFKSKEADIEWHLIGHLQTNKAKKAVQYTDLFHCLDSLKLAEKIDTYAAEFGKIQRVLVQINSGDEEQKSGIDPENCLDFLKSLSHLKNIRIEGLMCIGKYFPDPEGAREEFRLMKKVFDQSKELEIKNYNPKYLSMGMSHDYEVAMEEGANLVRVGSSIFGKRNYGVKE